MLEVAFVGHTASILYALNQTKTYHGSSRVRDGYALIFLARKAPNSLNMAATSLYDLFQVVLWFLATILVAFNKRLNNEKLVHLS